MISLGSDVVIIEIDKARLLVDHFLSGKSKEQLKQLQKWGVMAVLDELRSAVRGYDSLMEMIADHEH